MKNARYRDFAGYVRESPVQAGQVANTPLSDVDILPPCTPSKILGIGKNYPDKRESGDAPDGYPEMPRVFIKTPNSLVKHRGIVQLYANTEFRFGGEVGIIIGSQCKNIDKDRADEFIRGYTCCNDITQMVSNQRYGLRKKSFDRSLPIGPVYVEKDDLPQDARIRTLKNGRVVQEGNYSNTIYTEGELIEKISTHITLEPGDVVLTGSHPPAARLEKDDHVRVEIEGIGSLEHTVQ